MLYMPKREAALERLRSIGRQRTLAQEVLRETSQTLPGVVREAHLAGVPKKQIADLAGISRPTLDQWLKRKEAT
jgi:hypothetical protein